MEVNQLIREVKSILGEQVEFNKDMSKILPNMKSGQIDSLIEWCYKVKEGKIRGERGKKDGEIYFLTFKKIGDNTRSIIVKLKNSDFIEFHLGNHNYYDSVREDFGIKKNTYRY